MTYLQTQNYRIENITKIPEVVMPASYGLGIEKKCADRDSWYVVCFVKYNEKEGTCYIESVDTRIIDVDCEDFDDVKRLISCAEKIVSTANEIM